MKKIKLAGIVLWLLGICLYFYPDVATDLQEIKVQAFVKTYEREHKSRRRSVTGSRQEEYGYIQIPKRDRRTSCVGSCYFKRKWTSRGKRAELYHCSASGIPGKALFPGY